MDHQEISDLIELNQLGARYMMYSARKVMDIETWYDVFTEDGQYNAFGTPYDLDAFPMLLKSAPPASTSATRPWSSSMATPRPDRSTTCSSTRQPQDAPRLVHRRVRPDRQGLAHPPTGDDLHASRRLVRPRQRPRSRPLRGRPGHRRIVGLEVSGPVRYRRLGASPSCCACAGTTPSCRRRPPGSARS